MQVDPGQVGRNVMVDLVEQKTAKIIPEQGQWQVYFLGLTRGEWTQGAKAYQAELNAHPLSDVNWVSAGMRLVTLEEVDANLATWSV